MDGSKGKRTELETMTEHNIKTVPIYFQNDKKEQSLPLSQYPPQKRERLYLDDLKTIFSLFIDWE